MRIVVTKPLALPVGDKRLQTSLADLGLSGVCIGAINRLENPPLTVGQLLERITSERHLPNVGRKFRSEISARLNELFEDQLAPGEEIRIG